MTLLIPNMPYPLGLNFGPTYLTASYALDDGSVVPVTLVTASAAYQDFFRESLQKSVQKDLQSRLREQLPNSHLFPPESQAENLSALFTHEINAVISDASRVLESTAVDVKAISLPYHWNRTAQQAILSAAQAAHVRLAGIHLLLRYPRALDKAHDLESCLAEDDYLSLVVDYNRSYLHLLICETAKGGGYALVEGQVQLPHLGEDDVSKSESEQQYERISKALASFLSLTTMRDASSSTGTQLLPYHDIKAVVLAGEASLAAMQRMHDVLQQSIAKLGNGALFDSLDPLSSASMGAARAAKAQVDDPKSTRDFISMPDYVPDEPKAS